MNRIIIKTLLIYLLLGYSNVFADNLSFDSNGVKIHYKDIGSGSPIVFLHGYTMNSQMWNNTAIYQALSTTHRLITVDFRGHGLSDKPTLPSEYGPKVGKDIIALLDHLQLKKTHLVGFSMGAYVAGRLLVTHSNRINSATLISGYFPFFDKHEALFAEETAQHMEEEAEKHSGEEKVNLNALAATARGWQHDAVTDEEISKITVPVQAIFGSEERNELFEEQHYRLALPPTALPIVIIDGADHDSEDAAVLRPELIDSVKKIIKLASIN